MHNLIVSTLHESGIHTTKWFDPFTSHTSSHTNSMLLSNTNVKGSLGKTTPENIHSSTTRHGCRDTDDTAIVNSCIDQRVGKNGSEAGVSSTFLGLNSRAQIEFTNTMHSITGSLGRGVAISLDRFQVEKHWFVVGAVAELFQDWDHIIQIVSIYRANVVESQLLEQGTTRHNTSGILINAFVDVLNTFGQKLVEALGKVTEVLKRLRYKQIRCIGRELRGGDGTTSTGSSCRKTDLTVVVQDHNHPGSKVSCTIHCFVSHATRDSPVPNDRHTVVFSFVEQRLGNTHTLCGRNGCCGMPGSKGVIFTFFSLAKS
mmetsp:Transcript_56491/g.158506  ORF Transcript_56491/g.158506 Transcript_56491/m.158506 type:complete len:315 (-) Transcript_56491:616-1560(-)